MADKSLSAEQMRAYWDRTSKLMYGILFIWFIFSFVVHIFAAPLNNIRIFGFPLGFYMAAQGSLIVFVFLCWWNARAQNKIDEEFGVQDE
ncbi:MAG: DUF4212 domain-containing protein [Rhodospirillales bacterium]|nr:DUF4212 domain-containing protein [Rhodospirillales bacterium]